MFTNDRNTLRKMFFHSWQKYQAGETMEPLEQMIAQIIQQHPEYHSLLADEDTYLDMRILAFDALSNLIPLCIRRNDTKGRNLIENAIESMNKLLDSPQPPILHEVVSKTLNMVKKTQKNR